MVNLAGISFDHRMTEDTGATVADVAAGLHAARSIVELDDRGTRSTRSTGRCRSSTQIDLFLEARRMAERAAGWMLRHRPSEFAIDVVVDEFAAGIATIAGILDDFVTGRVAADIAERRSDRIEAGVPAELAARAGALAVDAPGLRHRRARAAHGGCSVEQATTAYWSMFEAFDLFWLWEGIGALPRSDRWQTQARSALRDDLLSVLAALTRNVLRDRRRFGSGLDRQQSAVGRQGDRHAHRDPSCRELRPDDAVGGAAAAAQPHARRPLIDGRARR